MRRAALAPVTRNEPGLAPRGSFWECVFEVASDDGAIVIGTGFPNVHNTFS